MDAQLGRLVRRVRAAAGGPGRDRRRRRPRRGARRSRRVAARQPALPVDDARAAGAGRARAWRRASSDAPVSTRRVFHTHARLGGPRARRTACARRAPEVVLGEAMKPFLAYGWQPQVMAVEGRHKAIHAGTARGLRRRRRSRARRATSARDAPLSRALRDGAARLSGAVARRRRPRRSARARTSAAAGQPRLRRRGRRARRARRTRRGRPTWPRSSTLLEQASGLFVRERVRGGRSRCCERILAADPHNLDAALRLATAHSALGHDARALAAFEQAPRRSPPARRTCGPTARCTTRAGTEWPRAVPLLEQVVAETPDGCPRSRRWPSIRERQGRLAEAVALRQRIYALRAPSRGGARRSSGELAMSRADRPLGARGASSRRAPRRARAFATTSSWASSTWPPGACRRRATRSTASRRRIPATRWRSSSARR